MTHDPTQPSPPEGQGATSAEPPPGTALPPGVAVPQGPGPPFAGPPPDTDDPSGFPPWSAGQVALGFIAAFIATAVIGLIVVGVVGAIIGADMDDPPPGLTMLGVLVQDVVLVATAIVFANMTRRPRPRDFGLRRVRFWPAVGIAALGFLGYFIFNILYTVAFEPNGEQTVTQDLGLDDNTATLIAGSIFIVVLAPVAEEFFFRGFLYRGLRNTFTRQMGRGPGIALAALVNGLVFGAVHFGGEKTLPVLPALVVLAIVFCLVYERTGSLFTVIAMHALINTLGLLSESVPVALALGSLMLVSCAAAPRLLQASRAGPAPVAA